MEDNSNEVNNYNKRCRLAFKFATEGFVELVSNIPTGNLNNHALGDWTILELVAHSARAFTTIEDYSNKIGNLPPLMNAAEYFKLAADSPVGSQARINRDKGISERAKAASQDMKNDLCGFIKELATRVKNLVDNSADDTPIASPFGQMSLIGYLPTRTFELTVHSLDLSKAADLELPDIFNLPISESLKLAAEIASGTEAAKDILLAVCGRKSLPSNFSLV